MASPYTEKITAFTRLDAGTLDFLQRLFPRLQALYNLRHTSPLRTRERGGSGPIAGGAERPQRDRGAVARRDHPARSRREIHHRRGGECAGKIHPAAIGLRDAGLTRKSRLVAGAADGGGLCRDATKCTSQRPVDSGYRLCATESHRRLSVGRWQNSAADVAGQCVTTR